MLPDRTHGMYFMINSHDDVVDNIVVSPHIYFAFHRDNVYRSKDIHNDLNPQWEEVTLELSTICGGNLDCPIEFAVFDHESDGKHELMGKLETTVNALVDAVKNNRPMTLMKKNKATGRIEIQKAEVSTMQQQVAQGIQKMSLSSTPAPAYVPGTPPSSSGSAFVDYMAGGCELNVVVAIDFTGSNGDPRKPGRWLHLNSTQNWTPSRIASFIASPLFLPQTRTTKGTLHHIDPYSRNQYEQAIAAIVSILLKYDSDQKIPVLGFGAKYGGVVRHVFQCGPAPEAQGLQGVLDAYNATFKSGLIMSKPTVFTEVLETAANHANTAQQAAAAKGQQAYTVLLIISDGAVSDVNATAASLSKISDSPLSVVIVGVGNADFSAMRFLDDVNAANNGKRDIAQFVAFNQHSHSSQSLTKATLEEIPSQLVSYFRSKNIAPLPAVIRNDNQIIAAEEEEEIDLSLDFGNEQEIVVKSGGGDFLDGFNAR